MFAETPRTPEEIVGDRQLVAMALARLNKRETEVIKCRVLEGKTLKETAQSLPSVWDKNGNVQSERVRQLQNGALRKMLFTLGKHERDLADIADGGRRAKAEALRHFAEQEAHKKQVADIARREGYVSPNDMRLNRAWEGASGPRIISLANTQAMQRDRNGEEINAAEVESELRRAAKAQEFEWVCAMQRILDACPTEQADVRLNILASFKRRYR